MCIPMASYEICFIILMIMSEVGALLVINAPSYPWYCHEGEDLVLPCDSDSTSPIKWIKNTAGNSWSNTDISPSAASNVSIRTCSEEPIRSSNSVVKKFYLSLADRGTYRCQNDGGERYDVYVNVLSVWPTLKASNNTRQLLLNCTIFGFDTNIPTFQSLWTYQKTSSSPPNQVPSSGRYSVYVTDYLIQLVISKPVKSDAGIYNCTFIFGATPISQNLSLVSYSGSIKVTEDDLRPALDGQTSLHHVNCCVTTLLVILNVLFLLNFYVYH